MSIKFSRGRKPRPLIAKHNAERFSELVKLTPHGRGRWVAVLRDPDTPDMRVIRSVFGKDELEAMGRLFSADTPMHEWRMDIFDKEQFNDPDN